MHPKDEMRIWMHFSRARVVNLVHGPLKSSRHISNAKTYGEALASSHKIMADGPGIGELSVEFGHVNAQIRAFVVIDCSYLRFHTCLTRCLKVRLSRHKWLLKSAR